MIKRWIGYSLVLALSIFMGGAQTPAVPGVPPPLIAADPQDWGVAAGSLEQVGSRTEHSKTFLRPDGKNETVFESNIHYSVGNGLWDDVDLNYSDAGVMDKNQYYRAEIQPSGLDAIDQSSGKGVRWFTPQKPVAVGRTASYSKDGLNWDYVNGRRGIKLEATVTEPQGFSTYSFTYKMLGGGADFTINAEGDALGEGFTVYKATILGADGVVYPAGDWVKEGGPRLAFSFDDSVLPLDAYPYVIDPTTIFDVDANGNDGNGTGTADAVYANVACASATTTGTNSLAQRDLTAGDYNIHVGFVRWDTSSIPDGDTIDSATLRLSTFAVVDADSRNFTIDWYDFGSSATCGDWVHGSLNDAASKAISAMGIGLETFTLTNVSNVNKTGFTGLRTHVDGGAPTGLNRVHWYTFDHATEAEPRLSVTHTTPVDAALTGTIGDGATEQEVRDGSGTIIITLTGDTWVAAGGTFDAQRQAIINGLDAAEAETNGWNAQVRDQLGVSSVVRTSSTVVTITIAASDVGNYRITSNEVITVTVPNAALVISTVDETATPTIAITAAAESAAVTGTLSDGGVPSEIVAGGETIIVTLTNTVWVDSGATFNAQRQNIIDNLDSNLSDQNGWDARRGDFAVGDVVRTSNTVVTITLSAATAYAIPATETITVTAPASALVYGSALIGSPTFNTVPSFQASGNRVSPAIDLSGVTLVAYCAIGWEATTPANTTVTVDTSVNGGSTYSTATNGSCPTGISVGGDPSAITDFRIRVNLATTDSTVSPFVTAMALVVQDTTGQALYYQLNTTPGVTITDRSSNSNAGTMSFPTSVSGITVTLDTLNSTSTGPSSDAALDIPAVTSLVSGAAVADNLFSSDETGSFLPGFGLVSMASDNSEIPIRAIWLIVLAIPVFAIAVMIYKFTTSVMFAGAALAMGALVIGVIGSDGLIPTWVLFLIIPPMLLFLVARPKLPI